VPRIVALVSASPIERSCPMGGFHRASMGKNKKVIEISPCKHFGLKGPRSE